MIFLTKTRIHGDCKRIPSNSHGDPRKEYFLQHILVIFPGQCQGAQIIKSPIPHKELVPKF